MKLPSLFSKLFSSKIAGLDIADQSVRYAILQPTETGFELAEYGTVPLPTGVIVSGNIEDPKRLSNILAGLRSQKGISHVRVSLPESHNFILKDAGMRPQSNHLRAEALSRVLIPRKHSHASMIVNFGETQTDISVAYEGKVYFAKSIPLPENPTQSLMDTFGISHTDAKDMKRSIGLSRKPEHEGVFVALAKDVMALARELQKSFVEWHGDRDEKRPRIKEVILVGSNAHIAGLPEYLSSSLQTTVTLGNPWMHVNSLESYVPPLHVEEALAYATALGLALGK